MNFDIEVSIRLPQGVRVMTDDLTSCLLFWLMSEPVLLQSCDGRTIVVTMMQ